MDVYNDSVGFSVDGLVISHFLRPPSGSNRRDLDRDFYEELSKFGRIEALHICDNLGDHMLGHAYCKCSEEEEAADALNVMNGRYYDGRQMEVEFSPVLDFREARCRDFDEDSCRRGGFW